MDCTRLLTTSLSLSLQDLDGNIIEQWEGVRVQALASISGEKKVLAADNQRRIREYFFDNENSKEEAL